VRTMPNEEKTQESFLMSLEILNISGNNLDSLGELSCLGKLQDLTANHNNIANLRDFVQLLSVWPCLKRLDTSRNPMCTKTRYRERLIVVSPRLGSALFIE
jgi:protein phosphatase 1 regulatory subunit 42